MYTNVVEVTGLNTALLKTLSDKETKELFIQFNNGDISAKEKLIMGNLKLVLSILKKYNNSKVNIDDLFQIGIIGLIKAIDNFDISYNLQLSTYAVPLIVGEIKRYIRDSSDVRISRSVKDLAYHIMKYKDEFFYENGVEPSIDDILNYLNITEYEYTEAMQSLNKTISIYEPIYNDGGDTIYLLDQISDKNSNKDDILSLKTALKELKEKEKYIILERYIVGKTQMELADELKVSQAQISRIESSSLKKLKKSIY